jgi:hypothetical protein
MYGLYILKKRLKEKVLTISDKPKFVYNNPTFAIKGVPRRLFIPALQ